VDITAGSNPENALVVKLGHIGDVLVTTPVLTALKERFPGIAITMVVNQGTEAMVRHSPLVDRLLVLERKAPQKESLLSKRLKMIRELRKRRYDLSLELSGGDRGAFLSLLSSARLRVGFEPKKKHIRSRAFHVLVNSRGTQNHVVETFLRQPRELGLHPKDLGLKFEPGSPAQARADEMLSKNNLEPGGFVLVHPTSRWMFKTWTAAGNAKVMQYLESLGLPVVLTCAPDKVEMDFAHRILKQMSRPPLLNLAGKVDLYLLGALIKRARLFFGVDSAPMHMAAGLNTPVVVLFGPSGEKMWGPWQVPSEVVTLDMDCRPCGKDGCQGSKVSRCLTELPPEMVIQAVDRLLERT
jgi:heptosyltransferase-3